jgi:hypothetical protein
MAAPPSRTIERLQFGVLSPDQVVRCSMLQVFVRCLHGARVRHAAMRGFGCHAPLSLLLQSPA